MRGYSIIYNPWLCLVFEAMESVTSSLSFTAAVTYAAKLSSTTTDTSIQGLLGGIYFGVVRGDLEIESICSMAPRIKWDPEQTKAAVATMSNKEMGSLKASRVFHVPQTTLERYIEDLDKCPSDVVQTKIVKIPFELEKDLADYCLIMENQLFSLSQRNVRRMAYQIAVKNGIVNPFSKKNKQAGKKWMKNFLRRNLQLVVHTPQGTTSDLMIFLSLKEPEENNAESPQQLEDLQEPQPGTSLDPGPVPITTLRAHNSSMTCRSLNQGHPLILKKGPLPKRNGKTTTIKKRYELKTPVYRRKKRSAKHSESSTEFEDNISLVDSDDDLDLETCHISIRRMLWWSKSTPVMFSPFSFLCCDTEIPASSGTQRSEKVILIATGIQGPGGTPRGSWGKVLTRGFSAAKVDGCFLEMQLFSTISLGGDWSQVDCDIYKNLGSRRPQSEGNEIGKKKVVPPTQDDGGQMEIALAQKGEKKTGDIEKTAKSNSSNVECDTVCVNSTSNNYTEKDGEHLNHSADKYTNEAYVPKKGNEKKGIICVDPILKQAEFRALRTQANTTRDVASGFVRKHPVAMLIEYFARRYVGVIRSHTATELRRKVVLDTHSDDDSFGVDFIQWKQSVKNTGDGERLHRLCIAGFFNLTDNLAKVFFERRTLTGNVGEHINTCKKRLFSNGLSTASQLGTMLLKKPLKFLFHAPGVKEHRGRLTIFLLQLC
uniref:(California timema) hypothetical protein n=1 Tax=Timema californicum TaxID=61474 RepID=A0A7R9P598_TIMCA|nr:unnamed protein product [Timema californicum]